MAYSIRTSSLLKAPANLIPLCPLLPSCIGGDSDSIPQHRPGPRRLHVDVASVASHGFPTPSQIQHLPRSCPGCGALTQTVSPGQPGFYGANRKSVKAFIGRYGQYPGNGYDGESKMFERVLGVADADLLSQIGLHGARAINSKGQIS